jgi:peptidyl-prolyl cis-trans isomerase C
MKWHIRNVFLVLAMFVLFPGCSSKPNYDDRIVLKAGNQAITMHQLNWQYLGSTFKSPEEEFQKKSAYLQRLMDTKLLANIGIEMGLENPDLIDSATESQMLTGVAHQNRLMKRLNYSTEDLQIFWHKYGATLKAIQIITDSKSKAEKAYSLALEEPDKFAEIRSQYSTERTAKSDSGLLDPLRVGQIAWQFDDIVFNMKPGEISKPFKTKAGWHIVKLLNRQEQNPSGFLQEKATAEAAYIKYTKESVADQYREKIKNREGFEVVDITLKMMKNKLDSLQNEDRQRGVPIRQFLKSEDLANNEIQKTLVKIKSSNFTAADYIDYYLGHGIPAGVDLFDADIVVQAAIQSRFVLVSQLDAIRSKVSQTREFKEQIQEVKTVLIYRKVIEQIKDTITISATETHDFYEENKLKYFSTPEKIRVSEILVNSEAEANLLLEQLNNGMRFANLIKKTVRPGMIEKNGDLGYLAMGDSGVIYDEAAKLGVGQYGGPVKSSAGYSIIMVKEKSASKALPYEQFENKIKENLKNKKLNDILVNLVEEQKKKEENFIDLELLKTNLITGKLQNAN